MADFTGSTTLGDITTPANVVSEVAKNAYGDVSQETECGNKSKDNYEKYGTYDTNGNRSKPLQYMQNK